MITLTERTPLHVPQFHSFEHDGITYALDGDAPNWIAVEERGASLLRTIAAAPRSFAELVASYANEHKLEAGKAWLHVHDFLTALDRSGVLSDAPFAPEPYAGRRANNQPNALPEPWPHNN